MRAALAIAAGVAGAAALVAATWAVALYELVATGRPALDRWRWPVLAELARSGLFTPGAARSVLAILNNESQGVPGLVGDSNIPRGPSIGLGQVLRFTAARLGLWRPERWAGLELAQLRRELEADQEDRQAYEALGSDPDAQGLLLQWAVIVFATELAAAGGDYWEAERRYNGSGSAAEEYADRAEQFKLSTWGET